MSVFFLSVYMMIGCLCYFCWRQHFCPTSV